MLRRYQNILQNWLTSAIKDVFSPDERPDLAFYGTGTDVWGIQTHMKGFSAFAVAAADPDVCTDEIGYTKEEFRALVLKMFRFTMESHKTGSYHCMDGDSVKWGAHWLAALAIERMMHGIDAIRDDLTDNDLFRLRCVLLYEAEYILNHRAVQADPVSPNVPESNLWSGVLLHRVAMMFPDVPHIDEYRKHGTHLLLNSISIPSDAESELIYDGKPMREWFVGANYFESYALNHHGYMNVGYMVICLSNIAMLHFSGLISGQDTPPALYHHCIDLWKLVRSFVFDDGRLCRIGGDGRVRYCYCQDYLTPVFLLIRNLLGENLDSEESGWLSMLEREMAYNGDGSFLSERCELLREHSPLYYTRLESDRACTVSMNCYWYRILSDCFENKNEKPAKHLQWTDEYHGAYYTRGEGRIAAFVWEASSKPQATVVPVHDSSMMEARFNMTSDIEGAGIMNYRSIKTHSGHMFRGGFITGGSFSYITSGMLEECDNRNVNALNQIVICALPDDRTVVTLQYCTALRRCWLLRVSPLFYQVPNDIFNGEKREYQKNGNSITVDGSMTVTAVYGGEIQLRKQTARTIGIQDIQAPNSDISECIVYKNRGMLRTDLLLINELNQSQWYDKNSILFDFGAVLRTDDRVPDTEYAADGAFRAIRVCGADGCMYVIAANFGTERIHGMAFRIDYDLDGGECAVYCGQRKL